MTRLMVVSKLLIFRPRFYMSVLHLCLISATFVSNTSAMHTMHNWTFLMSSIVAADGKVIMQEWYFYTLLTTG